MQDIDSVYFDTMLYLNKFKDEYKVKPDTNHMFSKVKSGEFKLVLSQTTLLEIYHVLCLPIEKTTNHVDAEKIMEDVSKIYKRIQCAFLSFPNTFLPDNEFAGINSKEMIGFVKNVPGSGLIDFVGAKLPSSMDFIHLMIASNLKCDKFFTKDKGILKLGSYQQLGDMKIIKPYKP